MMTKLEELKLALSLATDDDIIEEIRLFNMAAA